MRHAGIILGVSATLALAGCAAVAPVGPAVVVVPPEGKDLARFQQEDAGCRGQAQQHVAPAVAQASPFTPAGELQYRYDVFYAQCMVASGNRIQSFPVASGYGYPYGPAYGPAYGGGLSFGFFGGHRHFGRGFGHHGFHHGGRRG